MPGTDGYYHMVNWGQLHLNPGEGQVLNPPANHFWRHGGRGECIYKEETTLHQPDFFCDEKISLVIERRPVVVVYFGYSKAFDTFDTLTSS